MSDQVFDKIESETDLDEYPVFIGTKERASLFRKMTAVMARLERIPKNGELSVNGQVRYKFARNEDVADAIRLAMAEEHLGLFVSVDRVERDVYDAFYSNGKSVKNRTTVYFTFTFVDGDSGAERSVSWVGEAEGGDDKAISKAATMAEKYFLLKTFILSTGDEPDPDASGGDDHSGGGSQASGSQAKGKNPSGSVNPPANRPPASHPPASHPPKPEAVSNPLKAEVVEKFQAETGQKPPEAASGNGSQKTTASDKNPDWFPKMPNDYLTYFEKICPKFKLSKDEGAAVLKETENDVIEATKRIVATNTPPK